MNIDDYPVISIDSESSWEQARAKQGYLEERFPNAEVEDLLLCFEYNGYPEWLTALGQIEQLGCFQVGARDEEDWIWMMVVGGKSYVVRGGCDFTGWDCRSSYRWKEIDIIEMTNNI